MLAQELLLPLLPGSFFFFFVSSSPRKMGFFFSPIDCLIIKAKKTSEIFNMFLFTDPPQHVSMTLQKAAPHCIKEVSDWSPCSVTCGIGVSTRTTTQTDCSEKTSTRLCYLRPCNVEIPFPVREKFLIHLMFGLFLKVIALKITISIRTFFFKFCD